VSADGGIPQELAAEKENLIAPTWKADGRSLVFGSKSGLDSCEGDFLYQLDLETHVLSKVDGSEGLHYAMWSPDGHYLAASCGSGVKVLNLTTHQWSLLTKRGGDDFKWSHDSRYVYLDNSEEGIFRIYVRDGREEKVADTHGFQSAAGDFGIWMGLMPDDTPLLLRNLNSDRIYALDWDTP
jgi:WD40 repeat protein